MHFNDYYTLLTLKKLEVSLGIDTRSINILPSICICNFGCEYQLQIGFLPFMIFITYELDCEKED
ncbi:MAG: hypothetical protein ACPG5B_06850 [Chitinophagales bacterium]